jgi:predicted nucleic acid-binding protein
MRAVFADTFYFLALLDAREKFHVPAAQISRDPELRLVTTEWVLTEFGNAYSDPRDRADFVGLYRSLINHPRVRIISADTRLFQRGVDFFEQRPDKEWSLVDCLSFIVMRDEGIQEALTGDKHFEQAGFVVLFK